MREEGSSGPSKPSMPDPTSMSSFTQAWGTPVRLVQAQALGTCPGLEFGENVAQGWLIRHKEPATHRG